MHFHVNNFVLWCWFKMPFYIQCIWTNIFCSYIKFLLFFLIGPMHVQNYTYCSGLLNRKQWHSKDAEMWKPKSEYVQLFVDLHCRKSIFFIFYTNLSVLNLMINQMILCALHHENFNNFLFWHMYIISNNKMAMHMIVRVVKALYLTLATIITFRPFNYLIYICLVH